MGKGSSFTIQTGNKGKNDTFGMHSSLLYFYRLTCIVEIFVVQSCSTTRHNFRFSDRWLLLLHESSAESSCMSFLHYFHAAKSATCQNTFFCSDFLSIFILQYSIY